MTKKVYSIPCSWTVAGTMEIEANSLEEAMDIAIEDAPLPEGDYIDGSFSLDMEFYEDRDCTTPSVTKLDKENSFNRWAQWHIEDMFETTFGLSLDFLDINILDDVILRGELTYLEFPLSETEKQLLFFLNDKPICFAKENKIETFDFQWKDLKSYSDAGYFFLDNLIEEEYQKEALDIISARIDVNRGYDYQYRHFRETEELIRKNIADLECIFLQEGLL